MEKYRLECYVVKNDGTVGGLLLIMKKFHVYFLFLRMRREHIRMLYDDQKTKIYTNVQNEKTTQVRADYNI